MSTTVISPGQPGFIVIIRAYVPADPREPGTMADAVKLLDSLPQLSQEIGLSDVKVSHRFVLRHGQIRAPMPPPIKETS